MSAVMFPMFLPDGTYVDKLIRVIVAITLFEAAYTAEVIRGGLQALYQEVSTMLPNLWVWAIGELHLLVILTSSIKISYTWNCQYLLGT